MVSDLALTYSENQFQGGEDMSVRCEARYLNITELNREILRIYGVSITNV